MGDTQGKGDEEAAEQNGDAEVGHAVGQRFADARGAQYAAEHAARAGDEDDGADGAECAVYGFFQSRSLFAAAFVAEHDHGGQHGNQQGDGGGADHLQHLHPSFARINRFFADEGG